ncbi:RNA polymerase sigma factor [Thalassotalea profundi]|uniref:ECF RNA polymerase sigma factor SigW n=1 Tax=Thalassotalea profundi TaxID=2036687 RepID=A0ABQ3IDH7_9GAMM|nr:RNA polymerase sigma factor [Thalassotalea profundi]GHE76941.1 ECF RNA polymerase sigma factor SigW [Thalassotalea profundi]
MEQAKVELLVIEMQQGSEPAFKEVFDYFQPMLLRFAYKTCRNEQMAKDAVQNSWLKIVTSIKKLEDPRRFKSWIYQMVRWQSLDLIKKANNEKIDFTDMEVNEGELNSNKVDEKENSLLAIIDLLPDIDRQAIYLFYLEQMPIKDIAIILSIPIGTVKSRLNRARNTLKVKLQSLGE